MSSSRRNRELEFRQSGFRRPRGALGRGSASAPRFCRLIAAAAAAAIALLVLGFANAQAPELPEREVVELTLEIGEQKVIAAEDVRSYSEGTRGIVDVRLTRDASQFVVVGVKPGETTLLFILTNGSERHYEITVVDPNAEPGESEDKASVEARDNIRLDFYFVQLQKTYDHQLGVAWPGTVGGGQISASYDLLDQSFNSATAVVADQALPRLDMAQASGWAKVLRQAAVITANGTAATFSGGGEVNIPIAGGLAAEIRSITFGSTVKVLPHYDRQTGRIELQIEAQVADLVDDNGTGAPGRMTSDLSTVVNIELGQSLILAGLTARRETHSHSGLPVLSQIPILGGLFGSHSDRRQESENVIFIVPTVVDAVSVQAKERIREALEIYEEFDGDLEEVDFIGAPAGHRPRAKGARR